MKKTLNRIGKIGSTVFVILMALIVLYMLYTNITGKIPKFFGYSFMQIISPSMEPTLPVNSYILTEEVDTAELKKDDIITYICKDKSLGAVYGQPITHRIDQVITNEDGTVEYATKGDNNTLRDNKHVQSEDIVARYIKILPVISWLATVFKTPLVFIGVALIPALIFFVLQCVNTAKAAQEISNENGDEQNAQQLNTAGNRAEQSKPEPDSDPDPGSGGGDAIDEGAETGNAGESDSTTGGNGESDTANGDGGE